MYLEENLKLTPQNLSDKVVATDELNEIYQQVFCENHFTHLEIKVFDLLICTASPFSGVRKIF